MHSGDKHFTGVSPTVGAFLQPLGDGSAYVGKSIPYLHILKGPLSLNQEPAIS